MLKAEDVCAQLIGFRPEVSAHLAAEILDNASRIIGRRVVDDNHFLVGPVDGQRAFDRCANEVTVVIVRDDYREPQRYLLVQHYL